MPTQDEIFQKVQATLVDALGVDEEDVTRDATLQGDLGAESIDSARSAPGRDRCADGFIRKADLSGA